MSFNPMRMAPTLTISWKIPTLVMQALKWIFFAGSDPASLLEKYGDRFKLMHMKNLRKGVEGNLSGGTVVKNDVTLGTGQLDIHAIIKAVIKHFYLEDESPIYFRQVPKSRSF